MAQTDEEIAKAYHCHHRTVEEIRQRFVEEGLEAALERKKRIYTPKKMDGRCEAKLLSLACSTPPKGCERWTLRMLADKLVELEVVDSISCETVRKQLKKTNFNRIEKDAG